MNDVGRVLMRCPCDTVRSAFITDCSLYTPEGKIFGHLHVANRCMSQTDVIVAFVQPVLIYALMHVQLILL
ncbi:hypothetical protein, partial [Psychrobacter sp.]|uniref:hypothetical protein n=1 Tax=Psychrobacter sp. TaxID=56811 RepID=UPI0026477C33